MEELRPLQYTKATRKQLRAYWTRIPKKHLAYEESCDADTVRMCENVVQVMKWVARGTLIHEFCATTFTSHFSHLTFTCCPCVTRNPKYSLVGNNYIYSPPKTHLSIWIMLEVQPNMFIPVVLAIF